MQYPQIQFYRRSIVRLASGKLKHVEELSSDDFLESAPLASEALASPAPVQVQAPQVSPTVAPAGVSQQQQQPVDVAASQSPIAMDLDCDAASDSEQSGAGSTDNRCDQQRQQQPIKSISDTNNNHHHLSDDELSDVELVDVVTSDDLVSDLSKPFRTHSEQLQQHLLRQQASNHSSTTAMTAPGTSSSSSGSSNGGSRCNSNSNDTVTNDMMQSDGAPVPAGGDAGDHLYIESSVVRDFLEVGPPCSTSPASSTASLSSASASQTAANQFAFTINSTTGFASATLTSNLFCSSSSTSSSLSSAGSSTASSSTGSLATAVSPQPVAAHQHSLHLSRTHPYQHSSAATTPTPAHHLRIHSPSSLSTGTSSTTSAPQHQHLPHSYTAQQIIQHQNPTVLIKFFLETSRTIAFIEVPIEHPFFVFHRGWSSWSPQRTYDKFGLKCRKLKIGDTCISLVKRQSANGPAHSSSQSRPIIQFDRHSLSTTIPINTTNDTMTTSQQHSNEHQLSFKHRQALHKNSNNNNNQQQQESDQCNILFSSIKIHE